MASPDCSPALCLSLHPRWPPHTPYPPGWVVARFGLHAALLCFTVLVGITLLPALCLPMEVLSGKGGADSSQAQRGTRDGSARLSCLGGSEAKLGQGSEAGGPISVHVSGASQTAARKGGGHKAGPAPGGQPLGKSWSIGASLAAAGAEADCSRSPQPISLVADCRGGGGCAGQPTAPPASCSRPLRLALPSGSCHPSSRQPSSCNHHHHQPA